MTELEDVIAILPKLERPPGERIPDGLAQIEIDSIECRIGFQLPSLFRKWLMTTNGPCVGPGGIVGAKTPRELQNLESIYDLHPNWKINRWVPVAGDGCGNYYLLLANQRDVSPVVFVDVMKDSNKPTFIVGSNLWKFFLFLFLSELGESRWPFDREEVLKIDPQIASTPFLLPWNA